MKGLPIAILAFSVFVILFANTPHAIDCQTIWDCGPRENCIGGTCLFDGLNCKYDWECKPFQFCNGGTYQCQTYEGRCQTSGDCFGGKTCDANNYCVEKKTAVATTSAKVACKRASDCATGQKCTKNKCVASSTSTKTASASSTGVWSWIKNFFRIG
ncbi:MAG: hypothetical protein NTV88_01660 [Candidatus Micrarchaeota archaeon]|nr:hypothetical protein [Candidatus Micrarchaeota archaeon]